MLLDSLGTCTVSKQSMNIRMSFWEEFWNLFSLKDSFGIPNVNFHIFIDINTNWEFNLMCECFNLSKLIARFQILNIFVTKTEFRISLGPIATMSRITLEGWLDHQLAYNNDGGYIKHDSILSYIEMKQVYTNTFSRRPYCNFFILGHFSLEHSPEMG